MQQAEDENITECPLKKELSHSFAAKEPLIIGLFCGT